MYLVKIVGKKEVNRDDSAKNRKKSIITGYKYRTGQPYTLVCFHTLRTYVVFQQLKLNERIGTIKSPIDEFYY